MKVNNILDLIGNTPIIKLNKTFSPDYEVWVKLEKSNPGGSIKDRIALAMIEDAENKGLLNKDSIIIEPTSGNTGVGLAMVAAVKGYKIILVMPESMSVERRRLMASYGAEFVLTPADQGMSGAIKKADKLVERTANAWSPSQFENPSNYEVHLRQTGVEILKDIDAPIDFLITGVGTGGHFSGVAKTLKEKNPKLKAYAVEPINSPVIAGGESGSHKIAGIGAGFIPKNLHLELVDGTIPISDEEALKEARNLASKEGILAGISTGASIAAIRKRLASFPKGSRIVTFNYDTGERYLSVEGLF